MVQISFAFFLLFLGVFAGVMLFEPRSLWSGVSFFFMVLSFGGFLLVVAFQYAGWLSDHRWLFLLLLVLAAGAALLVLAFPLLLFALFLVQGIRVVKHEGLRPANLLSLLFAFLWFGYLFLWPLAMQMATDSLGTALYFAVSFAAAYLLALMAMYVLSAVLNLIHPFRGRRLDYIIVLGAGLNGSQLTPLLAGRVNRGIALLARCPKAKLVLSGGQGPGEDLPEGDAMAAYAVEKGVDPQRILIERASTSTEENLRFSRALMPEPAPRVAVVTTAYHVFRALVLARGQGMRCVGFGAKTKWYFTLNAVLREFAGYLRLSWKRHVWVVGSVAALLMLAYLLTQLG